MKATIKDVAKLANVSVTTVSLLLNGKSDSFSAETKKAVYDAVEELQYIPNRLAQNLSNNQSNLIALMVPDLMNPYYTIMAQSIMERMEQTQYNLALIGFPEDESKRKRISNLLRARTFDGALIVSSKFDPIIEELQKDKKFKYVLLDESIEIENSPLVTGNSDKGGRLAAQLFLEANHKKLACITGPSNTPNSNSRLKGFLDELNRNGVQINQEHILEGNYTYESGYENALMLLNEDITGIFALNDLMAYGAIRAFTEAGKSIPGNLSVVGYDNLERIQYLELKLTTIDQQIDAIGNLSIDLLIQLLEGKEIDSQVNFIEPLIVYGETVKKLGGK